MKLAQLSLFYVKIPIISLVATSGHSYKPHSKFLHQTVFSPRQILCDRIFCCCQEVGEDWPAPKNYLRDFLLKANSISSSFGVDGFQKNPLGDSVQLKDNMKIGKILQNIAFIRNSIDPLKKHK